MLGLGLGLNRIPRPSLPILNQIGDSVGAWSLTKLEVSATNAIRVRRDNDDEEQDIGFVGRELDTVSLLSFVGSNSAYITTWYDQTGNSNNATQTTADNQPRIVNAGVIETDSDGNVSLKFDGVNDYFDVTDASGGLDITSGGLSLCARHEPYSFGGYIFSKDYGSFLLSQYGLVTNRTLGTSFYLESSHRSSDGILTSNVAKVSVGTYDFINSKIYLDSTLKSTNPNSFTLTSRPNTQIGCRSDSPDGASKLYFYNGNISDIIVFNKALTQDQVIRLSK